MVNINLLPKEFIQQQKLRQYFKLAIFGTSIIVLITLIIYIQQLSIVNELNATILKLDEEIKKVQQTVDEVNRLKSVKSTLESRKQLVEQLYKNSLVYPKFMVDLLKVLDENVWITSMRTTFEYDENKFVSFIKVSLNCNSYDKIAIANFVSNIEKSGKFKDVRLGTINISYSDKYALHTFGIDMTYIVK